MPFRTIPLVTGEVYHVVNRGVAKAPIFSGKRDYERFLKVLNYYQYVDVPVKFSRFQTLSKSTRSKILKNLQIKGKRQVKVLSYCLMPNHFHLLLKQESNKGISVFMHKSGVSYGKYYNTLHERIGPLLQGMFKAIRIQSEEQLLHVSRYIHINPYVGLVTKRSELTNYPWSSLKDFLTEDENYILSKNEIGELFKSTKSHLEFLMDEADYKRNQKTIDHLLLE